MAGIKIGGNVAGLKITNCVSENNGGDGFHFAGNLDVELNNCFARGNGGKGFNIVDTPSLVDQLGLPAGTDPKQLAMLLDALRASPADQQPEVLAGNNLFTWLRSKGLDASTLAANLITISTYPQIAAFIARQLE